MTTLDPIDIVSILVAHWFGDWLFQMLGQRWMKDKHRSLPHLSTHVAFYTLPLVVVSPVWGLFNGAMHFIVDFVTARLSHRFWDEKRIAPFWMTIGTDQTIHMMTLFLSWGWLA